MPSLLPMRRSNSSAVYCGGASGRGRDWHKAHVRSSSARRPTAAQNGSLGSSFWPMANPPLVFARTWHELLPIVADDPSSRGQRGRRPHRARYLARNRCRRSRVTSQNQSCQHFALLHHRLMDLILWALLIGQGSDNKRTANH